MARPAVICAAGGGNGSGGRGNRPPDWTIVDRHRPEAPRPLSLSHLTAGFADRTDLVLRDVQIREELLMLGGVDLLELGVPPAHVCLLESGCLHDGNPFIF